MDLELNREQINYCEKVLDTSWAQEETQEAIVPDAYPDIQRIIDAAGQIIMREKNVLGEHVVLSGRADIWILYQPDGGNEICRMEVHIPFTMRADASGLDENGACTASYWLRGVDVRLLNPRKVMVRADIGVAIQAYQPREMTVCTGITGDKSDAVQQLTAQKTAYITTAVKEKAFVFSDELRLTSGPGGTATLLGTCANARCTESKIIGNKLIFKGETDLQILYLVNGEVCSAHFSMGFSQIMEVPSAGENAECTVDVCVTGLECDLSGDEMRTVNVALELLGQAVVCDPYPITLLQDAYSTNCQTTAEQTVYSFDQLLEHAVRPQSVREILETDAQVKSVIDCHMCISCPTQKREGEQIAVNSDICLSILYLDGQDTLRSLHRTLPVTGRLELPAHSRCHCRCVSSGEVFASPAVGGIEVRFPLEFHCTVVGEQRVSGITAVRREECGDKEAVRRPSVVLRMAGQGERMWDIAKSYLTTQEQIVQANQLETDEVPAGRMLLIPLTR